MSTLGAVGPDSPKDPVQMMWQVITGTIFPPMEGYICGLSDGAPSRGDHLGVIVFQVKRTDDNQTGDYDGHERQIFVVECKAANLDSSDEWNITENGRLSNYMGSIAASWGNAYCAIAIGTKVRFFEWSPRTLFNPMHPSPLNLIMESERDAIEEYLQTIKINGWDFAQPLVGLDGKKIQSFLPI